MDNYDPTFTLKSVFSCNPVFNLERNASVCGVKILDNSLVHVVENINNSEENALGDIEDASRLDKEVNCIEARHKLSNTTLSEQGLLYAQIKSNVHKGEKSKENSLTKVLRNVKISRRDKKVTTDILSSVCDTDSNNSDSGINIPARKIDLHTYSLDKKRGTSKLISLSHEEQSNVKEVNVVKQGYVCAHCGKIFREKSHIATHVRAHINVRKFKCDICNSLFKTKSNLSFHSQTHADAPFTCTECNKTYPERKSLNRHLRVVHRCSEKHVCDQCGRTFKSAVNLSLHYTLHTGSKPYSCQTCAKSFVYKSTYVAHLKVHEAGNKFNCQECPDRRSCQHHSDARPWLCTICGKGYPLKGTLKNHMKSHEPEKPYKCSECPKSFMKKQSLECHTKSEHRGERPEFMCDQCSQSYFNVFALKRHYLKHTSERSYSCDICGKAFWMKDALKVHMRSHSSVKSFTCHHCPRAFVHKHSLSAHIKTHIDSQPYSCNTCGKSFIHKYNLSRHEKHHQESYREQVLIKQVGDRQLQVL